MTKLEQAALLSLEVLELIQEAGTAGATPKQVAHARSLYITALREALEVASKVDHELVGYMRWKNGNAGYVSIKDFDASTDEKWHKIYMLHQQYMKPLTEDKLTRIVRNLGWGQNDFDVVEILEVARAIERAHGITE